MTKEELIALSDLNREDNIKYISSEAQGIAIALDSDRYAPTFCKLERAYICGRRKSEEQIEQLEKENAELKEKLEELKCCGNCQTVCNAEGVCYFLKDGTCNPRTKIKWVQKNDSKILEKQYPMI